MTTNKEIRIVELEKDNEHFKLEIDRLESESGRDAFLIMGLIFIILIILGTFTLFLIGGIK